MAPKDKTCEACKDSWGFNLVPGKPDEGICTNPYSENYSKDIHEDDHCDLWEEESNGK